MSGFEDFVKGCELDCVTAASAEPRHPLAVHLDKLRAAAEATHSHVAPDPEPAPRYTRAQQTARVRAWQVIAYSGGNLISWEVLSLAIDAYEESLRQSHTALGSVR